MIIQTILSIGLILLIALALLDLLKECENAKMREIWDRMRRWEVRIELPDMRVTQLGFMVDVNEDGTMQEPITTLTKTFVVVVDSPRPVSSTVVSMARGLPDLGERYDEGDWQDYECVARRIERTGRYSAYHGGPRTRTTWEVICRYKLKKKDLPSTPAEPIEINDLKTELGPVDKYPRIRFNSEGGFSEN